MQEKKILGGELIIGYKELKAKLEDGNHQEIVKDSDHCPISLTINL